MYREMSTHPPLLSIPRPHNNSKYLKMAADQPTFSLFQRDNRYKNQRACCKVAVVIIYYHLSYKI